MSELDKLREALRPLAALAEHFACDTSLGICIVSRGGEQVARLTGFHAHAARAALSPSPEPEGAEPCAGLEQAFTARHHQHCAGCRQAKRLSSQVAALEKLLRSAEDIVKDTNDLVAMLEKSLGLPPNSHNVINTVRAMVAQVAALEKERDAAWRAREERALAAARAHEKLGGLRWAAGNLCRWIRHTVPEWTSEVDKYLELTEAALSPSSSAAKPETR